MEIGYRALDGDGLVAAAVSRGAYETPVWIQSRWEEGEYAPYIRNNGCGHCCVAMAARLFGVSDITPYTEYEHCLALWGAPSPARSQGHFLSPRGVALSLRALGVSAEAFGYGREEREETVERMLNALAEGKLVIPVSFPERQGNPFSTGAHYVLLLGVNGEGRVTVANSSLKGRCHIPGIGIVTRGEIADALLPTGGVMYPEDTWGHETEFRKRAGYVIVG